MLALILRINPSAIFAELSKPLYVEVLVSAMHAYYIILAPASLRVKDALVLERPDGTLEGGLIATRHRCPAEAQALAGLVSHQS